MVHATVNGRDVFEKEISMDLLPKSLVSFLLPETVGINESQFLRELFGGLQCFTVCGDSTPLFWPLLLYCRNLRRLVFYHNRILDFSFLKFLPNLKQLVMLFEQGFQVEDAMIISRDAPNLVSLTLAVPVDLSADEVCLSFKNFGRELLYVKNLNLCCDALRMAYFFSVFLSDHSLFRQVTSLRILFPTLGKLVDAEEIARSNKLRPQCRIFNFRCSRDSYHQLCDCCWERRTSDWMCPRCECLVTALI